MNIPYGRQDVTASDIEAVDEVLRSDFLTQGPAVPRFESDVAALVAAQHAVAANSATSALHLACLALGLRPGQSLWTVPNTFVASANCARYCGADVDFVDIDPLTWNMSVPQLAVKFARAKAEDRLPAVIVPVHFAGQPTEQEAVWELAHEYGCRVLEDASHAIGASRLGEPVGSCRWSDITVFSFHPVKIITTGEGGLALTNDDALAERLRLFRSHGITRDESRFVLETRGPCYYEQQYLGFNYRMTDIQAALGSSQLKRLAANVERRNVLARQYDLALDGLPLERPTVRDGNRSAFHLYVVRLAAESVTITQRELIDGLRQRGIMANVHYLPVHLQPYYRALGFSTGQFPEAESHGRRAVSLPIYPSMTDAMQARVVSALRDLL